MPRNSVNSVNLSRFYFINDSADVKKVVRLRNKRQASKSPGKVAVIYARYSSHNQRDVSIEQQVKVVRGFAEEQGLQIAEVYADRAISGTTDNRPEFQRMIRDSKARAFQYVIVYSLDRFARDRFDSVTYKRVLKDHGVRVLSAMEHITDDPSGILMEAVLEGLAEYYSKELSTKIRRGLQDNAEKCMVTTSLPFGYRKGPDGKYQIEPAEAEVVREIFNRVYSHDLLSDIYQDLNARGIRTKHGAQWNKSSFNKLLSNERYIGTYIYGDIRIENGIPAIVDRNVFFAVQEEMKHRANPRGVPGKRRGKTVYLLTGKVFCGECKSAMIGNSGTSKSGALHSYYACKNQLQKACTLQRIQQGKLEYFIAKTLYDFALDDDLLSLLADSAMSYQQELAAATGTETEHLKSELRQVESAIKNIMRAIEQGIITDDTKSRMMDLDAQKKALQAQIAYRETDNRLDHLTREELIAAFQLLREGEIENTVFQELLFNMFLRVAYVFHDHVVIVVNYAKNGHDTIEIPFNVDEIPDVPCSFKRKWWRLEEPKRTIGSVVFIGDMVVLSVPFTGRAA